MVYFAIRYVCCKFPKSFPVMSIYQKRSLPAVRLCHVCIKTCCLCISDLFSSTIISRRRKTSSSGCVKMALRSLDLNSCYIERFWGLGSPISSPGDIRDCNNNYCFFCLHEFTQVCRFLDRSVCVCVCVCVSVFLSWDLQRCLITVPFDLFQ